MIIIIDQIYLYMNEQEGNEITFTEVRTCLDKLQLKGRK